MFTKVVIFSKELTAGEIEHEWIASTPLLSPFIVNRLTPLNLLIFL